MFHHTIVDSCTYLGYKINILFLFQISGDIFPADDEDDSKDSLSRHLCHLGVSVVRVRSVDRRLPAENLRRFRVRLCRVHGGLVEEQGLPQDLHARGRLPHVLPHATHLHRHLLRTHRRARVEAQRAGHARHACADQHPPREDPHCAHARRRLRDVRAVVAAALLDRVAHVVRAAAEAGGEDTSTDVPGAAGAVARRLK